MKDIMQTGLTNNEINEIKHFLHDNPYAKLIDPKGNSSKRIEKP